MSPHAPDLGPWLLIQFGLASVVFKAWCKKKILELLFLVLSYFFLPLFIVKYNTLGEKSVHTHTQCNT